MSVEMLRLLTPLMRAVAPILGRKIEIKRRVWNDVERCDMQDLKKECRKNKLLRDDTGGLVCEWMGERRERRKKWRWRTCR